MRSASLICRGIGLLGLCWFSLGTAYDYSKPMRSLPALPLTCPESPFVLRFNPAELQAQRIWSNRIDAIVISREAAPPIRTGAQALHATLGRLGFGPATVVEMDPAGSSLSGMVAKSRLIVMGTPADFALAAMLARDAGLAVTDERLNGDGFIVKPVKQGERDILLITSPVARGVLYGAFEVEERTGRNGVPLIDDCFVPSVRLRGWPIHSFVDEPPDVLGRWRLNLSIASDWGGPITKSLLFYHDFPELDGEKHRELILAQQKRLHAKYANAITQGAMPMVNWNPLSFTLVPGSPGHRTVQQVIAAAHPGILAKPETTGLNQILGADRQNMCPSHPATRRFVAGAVRELVETFPELEVMLLSLSDQGGELLCGCEKCRAYPFLDRVSDYTRLVVEAARSLKPSIRFVMCPSALMYFIPAHYPELKGEVAALKELKRRLGPDIEAYVFAVGTPPGGDCQSWLSPDCAMLGEGVPIMSFFQHYEADGPGIVSPISSIISHLSWSLPIHLQTLKRHVAGGMVGALGQGAGVEVAYWHPELDGRRYLANWCQAKFGEQAGRDVYDALQDTHRITEAFHLPTKPDAIESVDFYRWGDFLKPWAIEMGALAREGFTDEQVARIKANIEYSFTIPQAPQPEELRRVRLDGQEPWLRRFELKGEIAIADRAERLLRRAMAEAPGDSELAYLYEVARATQALTRLFRDYHQALVHATIARNTAEGNVRRAQVELARRQLAAATVEAKQYREIFLRLIQRQDDALVSIKFQSPVKYAGMITGLVREATGLFEREFGGPAEIGPAH